MATQAATGVRAPSPLDPTAIEQAAFICWQGARALQAIADIAMRDGHQSGPPFEGFPFLKPEDLQALLETVSSHIERGYDAVVELCSQEISNG